MTNKDLQNQIANHIENRQHIKLTMKHEDYPLSCVPLGASEQLLYVKYIYDFMYDGYKILRIKDLRHCARKNPDVFQEHIMNSENLIIDDSLQLAQHIDSWKSLFKNSIDRDILLDISTKDLEYSKKTFFVGTPTSVNIRSVVFREIDTCGQWAARNTEIILKDILSVSVGTRYLTLLHKYQTIN